MRHALGMVATIFCLTTWSSCSETEPASELFAPTLTNEGATNLARTSVTLSGKITGNTQAIKEYGFKCSTSEAFPSDQTKVVPVTSSIGSSSFSAEITDLSPNQHYYYCLYASTGSSTLQAKAGEFTTLATANPTFGELRVDSIGENVIRLSCNVEEIGDNYLMEYGFSYRAANSAKTYTPVAAESFTDASTRTYQVSISGLQAATKYEIRPYAKNSSTETGEEGVREGYGETQIISTENLLSPEVTTQEVTAVGINSAKVSGIVTQATGSDGVLDECGFCWSTVSSDPSITDESLKVDVTELNKQFIATLSNLQAKTLYYVRAYARNTVNGKQRYGYGDVVTFETTGLETPQLEISNIEKSATSITFQTTITNYDAGALIEKGIIWSQSNAQVTLDDAGSNKLVISQGANIYSATLSNLTINTRYYVRSYAIYSASGVTQTGYSTSQSITTDDFNTPTFDELVFSDITYHSAKLQGAILEAGNTTITEKGFCWSTKSDPTVNDNKLVADESFTAELTKLNYSTRYYVRQYAICQIGNRIETAYSSNANFTTKEIALPQIGIKYNWSKATSFSAWFDGTLTNPGDGEVFEVGFIGNKIVNGEWNWEMDIDHTDCKVTAILNEDGTFSARMEDICPGNDYAFRAYAKAKVGDIVVTGFSGGVSVGTRGLNLNCEPQRSVTSITLNATLTDTEYASKIKEVGFYWTEDIGDGIDWSQITTKQATTLDANNNFSAAFTGLKTGTAYSFRAYIVTDAGEGYQSGYYTFRTLRAPSDEDNPSPDQNRQ